MAWNPTNANDVSLTISTVTRDESGAQTGTSSIGESANIVIDEFSIEEEEDLSGLSGVGNNSPQDISHGDIERSFSFTVQGEDADLFTSLTDDEGRAQELQIIAKLEDYKDKLTGCYAGTRNLSGSSGDAVEYEVEGIATGRDASSIGGE